MSPYVVMIKCGPLGWLKEAKLLASANNDARSNAIGTYHSKADRRIWFLFLFLFSQVTTLIETDGTQALTILRASFSHDRSTESGATMIAFRMVLARIIPPRNVNVWYVFPIPMSSLRSTKSKFVSDSAILLDIARKLWICQLTLTIPLCRPYGDPPSKQHLLFDGCKVCQRDDKEFESWVQQSLRSLIKYILF